jgi:PA14 domain
VDTEFLTKGIPGVTGRLEWFGIDYHGEFWIGQPGEYGFELTADDGANLYIDDALIIDLNSGGITREMLVADEAKIREVYHDSDKSIIEARKIRATL